MRALMLALVLGAVVAADTPPVRVLSVNPRQGVGPLAVRVSIHVVPNPDNVELCVWLDGEQKAQHSCFPHDGRLGVGSERVVHFTLPEGEYHVWAVLYRAQNESFTTPAVSVRVI